MGDQRTSIVANVFEFCSDADVERIIAEYQSQQSLRLSEHILHSGHRSAVIEQRYIVWVLVREGRCFRLETSVLYVYARPPCLEFRIVGSTLTGIGDDGWTEEVWPLYFSAILIL